MQMTKRERQRLQELIEAIRPIKKGRDTWYTEKVYNMYGREVDEALGYPERAQFKRTKRVRIYELKKQLGI